MLIRIADQDSDSLYVTNQHNIVNHAKYCYTEYPTIVNNIPKDANTYDSSMADFAAMDNLLAGSQRDIGESSNIAQIAQSYSYSFDDPKYNDYIAELSVLAQASIDSAKRRFDIQIAEEIKLIKQDMDIEVNGYPKFWKTIKRGFDSEKINKSLKCPMDYLQGLRLRYAATPKDGLSFKDFLIPIKETGNKKTNKKIEKFIEDYSLLNYRINVLDQKRTDDYDYNDFILLRSDFDELIQKIRGMNLSRNYRGLVYWLINRAFMLSPGIQSNMRNISRITNKNRSLLLKILYEVNPDLFLSCFYNGFVTTD